MGKKVVMPAARRKAVAYLAATFRMSEQRACRVVGADRASVRYEGTRPDDGLLRARLKELAVERRRFGYRRMHVLLKREGHADAERHDVPGARALRRRPAGRHEGRRVADDVVGCRDQDDRLRVDAGGVAGRDRDGGGRIPPLGFEQDVGRHPGLHQLLGHDEAGLDLGEDDEAPERAVIGHARRRRLEGGFGLAHELRELLRQALPRSRLKPRLRSSAQDHRDDQVRLKHRTPFDCHPTGR